MNTSKNSFFTFQKSKDSSQKKVTFKTTHFQLCRQQPIQDQNQI